MEYETPDLVVREIQDVTVVRLRNPNLTGSLEIQHIAAEIDTLLEHGVRKLVVDFKYVEHASSAALGLLITVQKKVTKLGGKLILSHSEKIGELLRVSRTAGLFKLAPDPRAAFKMF